VYEERSKHARPTRTLVLQCAWCRRVAGADGVYLHPPQPHLREATHGICAPCLEVWHRTAAQHWNERYGLD
jgi:hypothetical protein